MTQPNLKLINKWRSYQTHNWKSITNIPHQPLVKIYSWKKEIELGTKGERIVLVGKQVSKPMVNQNIDNNNDGD